MVVSRTSEPPSALQVFMQWFQRPNVPIRRSERPPRHLRAPAPVTAAVFLRHPLSHWPNTPFKCSGAVPRGSGWGKFAGPPRTLTTEWRVLFGAMVRRPRAEAREKLRLSPPGTRGQCGPDSTRSKPSSLTWLPVAGLFQTRQRSREGGPRVADASPLWEAVRTASLTGHGPQCL